MLKLRTPRHNIDRPDRSGRMRDIVNGQAYWLQDAKSCEPFHPSQVTVPGHVLRRTSLNELPQLVDVLRGDMGLIGPRPNIPG